MPLFNILFNDLKEQCMKCKASMTKTIVTPLLSELLSTAENNFTMVLSWTEIVSELTLKIAKELKKKNRFYKRARGKKKMFKLGWENIVNHF